MMAPRVFTTDSKEKVIAVVKQSFWELEHASDALKNDEEVVLAAVERCGLALKHASIDLKKNKKVVLAAVKQDSSALQYASEDLKNDEEIVLAVVSEFNLGFGFSSRVSALEYASKTLMEDKQFVLKAVEINSSVLKYASPELQDDKEVVLAAVKQSGFVLEYASEDLKKDEEVVLAAVSDQGFVLQCASEDLKKDEEVVLIAVAQNPRALQFASKELQDDLFLKELSQLENSSSSSAAFLMLTPLKNKLKQEKNKEYQHVAENMIQVIQRAILNRYQDPNFDLQSVLSQAVTEARTTLEQQHGWKAVIDAVANAILNFFSYFKVSELNQEKTSKRFSFFANPNVFEKEIKQAEDGLNEKFKPQETLS